jgi:hypothetical protein
MTTWVTFPADRINGEFITVADYDLIVSNCLNLQERVQTLMAANSSLMPIGSIMIWYGTQANIPTGWQLADGTNGTPDLRGKFILGIAAAEGDGDINGTGGAIQHNHSGGGVVTSDSHGHADSSLANTYGAVTNVKAGSGTTVSASNHYHWISPSISGGSHTHSSGGATSTETQLPPYKKYYYVARIPA